MNTDEIITECSQVAHNAFLEVMSTGTNMTYDDAAERGKYIEKCILDLKQRFSSESNKPAKSQRKRK